MFILCKISRFLYLARLAWNCLFTPLWGSFFRGGGYSGVKFSGIPLDPRSGTFVLGSGRLCLEIRHLRWEIHHLKIENVGFWIWSCILPLNEISYYRNPQKDRFGRKQVVWATNCENLSMRSTWVHAREKYSITKIHKTVIFHLSGEKLPVNGLKWNFALV